MRGQVWKQKVKGLGALGLTLQRTLLEPLRPCSQAHQDPPPWITKYPPLSGPPASGSRRPCACTLGLVVPATVRPRSLLPLAFADAPPRSFANQRGAAGPHSEERGRSAAITAGRASRGGLSEAARREAFPRSCSRLLQSNAGAQDDLGGSRAAQPGPGNWCCSRG